MIKDTVRYYKTIMYYMTTCMKNWYFCTCLFLCHDKLPHYIYEFLFQTEWFFRSYEYHQVDEDKFLNTARLAAWPGITFIFENRKTWAQFVWSLRDDLCRWRLITRRGEILKGFKVVKKLMKCIVTCRKYESASNRKVVSGTHVIQDTSTGWTW